MAGRFVKHGNAQKAVAASTNTVTLAVPNERTVMRLWITGLLAAPLLASASIVVAKPLSPELKAQMAANLARGDLLYEYDQTAWHTTDAMIVAVPDELKKLLRGYVIAPDGDNFRTTFFGIDEGREFAIYAATWNGKEVIRPILHTAEPRPTVTAEEHRLIEARSIALRRDVFEKLGFCKDGTPNVAVIPGATVADPISIYLMTPQSERGVWPLGGHHRIDVKDGRIVGQRAFTKSCVNLGGGAKKGDVALTMAVTHLLDPIPTEIHAFTVHASGVPLVVGTSDGRIFTVDRKDGKIFVEQDK